MKTDAKSVYKRNIFLVVFCYALWGILPLYWHMLTGVDAIVVLCCRIVFAAVFSTLMLCCMGRFKTLVDTFKNREVMKYLLLAAPVIAANWGLYIWSVIAGHTLDASLGYYMNPLIVFAFSVLLFKEKCGKLQLAAVALAVIGVIVSVVIYGSMPFMPLGMACTFALYGLIKKLAHADPIASIAVESIVLAPFAIAFVLIFKPAVLPACSALELTLLILGGAITAVPLMAFSSAVNNVPFVTVGFAQYISPTLMALCGFIMGEVMTRDKLIPMIFVVAALVIYTIGMVKQHKETEKAGREAQQKAKEAL